jgi:hypothetical protein
MTHRLPIIGFGWKKIIKGSQEFINISVSKAEIDKIPVDARGSVNLTITNIKDPKDTRTHIVYEDDHPITKRAKEHVSQTDSEGI